MEETMELQPDPPKDYKLRNGIIIAIVLILLATLLSIMLDLNKCQTETTLKPGINYIVLLKDGKIGVLNVIHNYENVSDQQMEDMISKQMITTKRKTLAKYELNFRKTICLDQYNKEVK